MKIQFSHIVFLLLSTLLFTACNSDTVDPLETPFEQDLAELNNLRASIESFAQSSVCGEDTACLFSPLGSNPCGDPETYIIFSTSINTEKLDEMISDYNLKQAIFNDRWNPLNDDCTAPKTPIGFDCSGNACDPIF